MAADDPEVLALIGSGEGEGAVWNAPPSSDGEGSLALSTSAPGMELSPSSMGVALSASSRSSGGVDLSGL